MWALAEGSREIESSPWITGRIGRCDNLAAPRRWTGLACGDSKGASGSWPSVGLDLVFLFYLPAP